MTPSSPISLRVDFDLPENCKNLTVNNLSAFRSISPEPNQFQRELTAKLTRHRENTVIKQIRNEAAVREKYLEENLEPTVIRSTAVRDRYEKSKSMEPLPRRNQESKKSVRIG